jgi:hypothetical protein
MKPAVLPLQLLRGEGPPCTSGALQPGDFPMQAPCMALCAAGRLKTVLSLQGSASFAAGLRLLI